MGHYFGVALRLTAKPGKKEKLQKELDRKIKKGFRDFITNYVPLDRIIRSYEDSFAKAANGNDACVYIESGKEWIGDTYYSLGNSKSFDLGKVTKELNSLLRLLTLEEGQVLAYSFFEEGGFLECIYIRNGKAVHVQAGKTTYVTLNERYLKDRIYNELEVRDDMTFEFIKDGLPWNLNDFDESLIRKEVNSNYNVHPTARVHVDMMRAKLQDDKSKELYIARILVRSRNERNIITSFVTLDHVQRSVSLSLTHSHTRKERRFFNKICIPLFSKHNNVEWFKKDNKDFPYSLSKRKFINLIQEHFEHLSIEYEDVKINLPEGCSLI